jgi:hypothetical protein
MKWQLASMMVLIVIAAAHVGVLADTADDADARDLAAQLASVDQTVVDQAIDEIHTLLESNPDEAVAYCRRYWLPSLLSASNFALADRLALDAILAAPWRTSDVEFFAETRARVMLRCGQPAAALSDARSLFNVASLRGTERALLLLTECLKAAHGEDKQLLQRFRHEQIAGATTRPATDGPFTSQTIAQIGVDPSPYAAAISRWVNDDDQSRRAKGNLRLLAGRSAEAQTNFEQMLRSSASTDRIGLAENLARAIKASDGTIGRANGYMLAQSTPANPN